MCLFQVRPQLIRCLLFFVLLFLFFFFFDLTHPPTAATEPLGAVRRLHADQIKTHHLQQLLIQSEQREREAEHLVFQAQVEADSIRACNATLQEAHTVRFFFSPCFASCVSLSVFSVLSCLVYPAHFECAYHGLLCSSRWASLFFTRLIANAQLSVSWTIARHTGGLDRVARLRSETAHVEHTVQCVAHGHDSVGTGLAPRAASTHPVSCQIAGRRRWCGGATVGLGVAQPCPPRSAYDGRRRVCEPSHPWGTASLPDFPVP
jgi:hypothetical protein